MKTLQKDSATKVWIRDVPSGHHETKLVLVDQAQSLQEAKQEGGEKNLRGGNENQFKIQLTIVLV